MKKLGLDLTDNGVKKLGLDLGNSSMKIVGGEGENLVYKRIRSLATTHSEDTNHVVDIDGEAVHFGVGMPLIEHDKTERKYLAHSILLSVYEIYGPGEHEVSIGLTLPINLYKIMKDAFKKKIEELKKLSGTVNGNTINVTLRKVNIQAEGLTAFYALMPEIPKGPILFVDMGHRTTDIISANVDTETKKWKIEQSTSLQFGGYELLTELQSALFPVTKTFFTIYQIEQMLAAGGKVGKIQINTLYKDALSDKVTNMLKEMHQVFNDMPHREVYICGGGAPMVEACYDGENLHVIPEQKMIYSNAVGSYLKI